jgi:thioredoxin-like negative regulator of GroEL
VRAQGIRWRHDYNSARKEALEKGRPLLLDFTTDNCFWCRRQDETTFQNPAVQKILNEQYIPIKVDAQRSPYLAEFLQVQGYPTIVLATTEGKILHTLEGYQEAGRLSELLQRTLAAGQSPEGMTREYEEAVRAANLGDHARAVALLRRVTSDGRDRPVQVKARQLLNELETKGLATVGEAKPPVSAVLKPEDRARRASDLLEQAREDLRTQRFLACIECCETVVATFAERPEAAEAARLLTEIRSNPEWMQQACETASERLGNMYLSLADACLARGQSQQAVGHFERILTTVPGTRAAESARARLAQVNAR